MSSRKVAVAATTFACMTLFSFGWSEQHGVSLSVASAQAQTRDSQARPSKNMAARTHRSARHVARGYAPNPVVAGADVAAGAVNTAGAVAAGAIGAAGAIASAPFGGPYAGYAAGPYYAGEGGGYYGTSTWGDYDCRAGYADCRPYGAKDWYRH